MAKKREDIWVEWFEPHQLINRAYSCVQASQEAIVEYLLTTENEPYSSLRKRWALEPDVATRLFEEFIRDTFASQYTLEV